MTHLIQASHQWASRPNDERFVDLFDLDRYVQSIRDHSAQRVLPIRAIEARPAMIENKSDSKSLVVVGPNGGACNISHWAFSQLAQRASAPAEYLRSLPSELAADNLNYGLRGNTDNMQVLLQKDMDKPALLRAITGEGYGRVWNADVTAALVKHFGDGLTGDWRIPGEFGKQVDITKDNTTLYASDRDMFVFLADEQRRIEVPNRRNGESGSLARGFFIWNSEVGKSSLGFSTFLFDYVCKNRIVWGATDVKTISIRHTKNAPGRFIEEIKPALLSYARESDSNLQWQIEHAQNHKIARYGNEEERNDTVQQWLTRRFSKTQAAAIMMTHETEEHRPIETLWDAVTGITAYAKGIEFQDKRVEIERVAGELLAAA